MRLKVLSSLCFLGGLPPLPSSVDGDTTMQHYKDNKKNKMKIPFDKDENCSKTRAGRGRGKIKPRHKFTRNDLKILQQLFEKNPYPNYVIKHNLAQKFGCQVCVIENWFQNRRSRLPSKLRDKNDDTRRTSKSQDKRLTGHLDTQTQEASGEQVDLGDSMVQCIRMRSSGTMCYQGAGGSGSSFNLGPAIFIPPAVWELYDLCNWLETSSAIGYVPSGQGQMDGNHSWLCPQQQQNNWGGQQQLQQPQSYQETSLAECHTVHQSHGDLGQQRLLIMFPRVLQPLGPSSFYTTVQSLGIRLDGHLFHIGPISS
ncbi:uncharacterized protein LOC127216172 [Phodopus roborovskii]|uniref:uncharacterized protein LOC127216172 n=1 Tax=Phodopus roborovskii TaxID=109678 RepID=UPI0021E3BA5C|nr:uncharacterized protein LOC127216172 [Phodopus roborovskii]